MSDEGEGPVEIGFEDEPRPVDGPTDAPKDTADSHSTEQGSALVELYGRPQGWGHVELLQVAGQMTVSDLPFWFRLAAIHGVASAVLVCIQILVPETALGGAINALAEVAARVLGLVLMPLTLGAAYQGYHEGGPQSLRLAWKRWTERLGPMIWTNMTGALVGGGMALGALAGVGLTAGALFAALGPLAAAIVGIPLLAVTVAGVFTVSTALGVFAAPEVVLRKQVGVDALRTSWEMSKRRARPVAGAVTTFALAGLGLNASFLVASMAVLVLAGVLGSLLGLSPGAFTVLQLVVAAPWAFVVGTTSQMILNWIWATTVALYLREREHLPEELLEYQKIRGELPG